MVNINWVQKFCQKIDWDHVKSQFKRYRLKHSSARTYGEALQTFCLYISEQTGKPCNPYEFPKVGLELIEDWTTDFIADHRGKLAPKYLNVVFNAIKRWCYARALSQRDKI